MIMRWIPPVLLSAFFLLSTFQALGQNGNEEKGDFRSNFEEGNKLIEEGIYEQAIERFKKCVELQPDNSNANYKLGFSYIKSGAEKKEALPYLAKAVKDVTGRYDPYSHRESAAPPMAWYYYGRSLHLNMKLDSALSTFKKFQDEVPKRHKLYDDSERQLQMVKYAKEQVADPKDVELKNLGKPINTEYPEYTPVISVDENVMYFTSRRPPSDTARPLVDNDGLPFEDIYASYKNEDGEWGEPERLSLNSNSRHDAVIGTSPDGQRLFIYRDDQGNGDIFQSWRQGVNEWSEPESMGPNINTDAWEPHGTLSPDGSEFYFVSDRKGGEGGRDIYRVKKLPTGEWSKAKNLGPTINTPQEEDAPFIHPDGETMYFSSNGHQSMGGFDIYFSEKKEDGGWTEPVNMGYPINTVDNDLFFMTSADGKRGYYASQKEDGHGARDIYMLQIAREETKELAVMKGFINVAEEESMPEDARVRVTDLSTKETKIYRPRERDGAFVSILPPCKEYKVEYMMGDEPYQTERLEIPCDASYQEINKEVYLNPVELGESQVAERKLGRKRQWKVLREEEAYGRTEVVVHYLNDGGNVTFTEKLEKDGTFPYYELEQDESYSFQVQVSEPGICDQLSLILVDQDGKEMARTERIEGCKFAMKERPPEPKESQEEKAEKEVQPVEEEKKVTLSGTAPSYSQNYGYNELGLSSPGQDYQGFLQKARKLLKEKENVKITILGSASRVPTETYDSNKKLSRLRAEAAEKVLKEDLKEEGAELSKADIQVDHQVDGPPFEEGKIRSKSEYMEYQFVRITIE